MKSLFATLALLLAFTTVSSGQGTLQLRNSTLTPVIFAPNWPQPGHPVLAAENFYVQLFWAPLGTTDRWLFQPLGNYIQVGFPAAGIFTGGTQTIPGITPGGTVSCYVEVFNTFNGFYERFGFHDRTIFTVDTADPTTNPAEPPVNIYTGSDPFEGIIITLPEPSSAVLVGAGALLLYRARRQMPI